MLLEDAGRATVRNFSTLFLTAALLLLPLHLAYALIFKSTVEVRELHHEISELPERRQIRNVSGGDVVAFRIVGFVLVGLELALIPIYAGVAREVVKTDEKGGIPTAIGAWKRGPSLWRDRVAALRTNPGPVIPALLIAIATAWLWERSALTLVDMTVPDARSFAFFGLAQGTARALAAPFLGAAAALVSSRPKGLGEKTPNLYSGRT